MMLKILQGATILVFLVIFIIGIIILFTDPDAMGVFGSFVATMAPLWFADVTAAFLGKPLKEFVAAKREQIKNAIQKNQTTE